MPSDLDHLEIGTISFARCEGEMMLRPSERVRLIAAAAEAYDPDLLVTAGHAIHSMKQLERLARDYLDLGGTGERAAGVCCRRGGSHEHAISLVQSK